MIPSHLSCLQGVGEDPPPPPAATLLLSSADLHTGEL
nr:MAG TPA: hypothetical protein [Caudoviricetes sp.]